MECNMNTVYREALSEAEYVLSFLDKEKQNKIPIKLRNLINREKSKDYTPKFDLNKTVEEQEISKEAIALLAYIYQKYIV